MATIEELLRAALLTMDAVTAIVGEGDAAKIRADHPEESDDPPYIVMEYLPEPDFKRIIRDQQDYIKKMHPPIYGIIQPN